MKFDLYLHSGILSNHHGGLLLPNLPFQSWTLGHRYQAHMCGYLQSGNGQFPEYELNFSSCIEWLHISFTARDTSWIHILMPLEKRLSPTFLIHTSVLYHIWTHCYKLSLYLYI